MDHTLGCAVCVTSLLQQPAWESKVVVPAELLDALVEAVVFSPDPRARSAVIRSLVHEMCAAVRWLHGGDTTFDDAADVELASISQLAAAAQDHHSRMSMLGAGAVRSDPRAPTLP